MPNKPYRQHHTLNMTFKHLLSSDSILNIHKINVFTPLTYIIHTRKHIKPNVFFENTRKMSYVLITLSKSKTVKTGFRLKHNRIQVT